MRLSAQGAAIVKTSVSLTLLAAVRKAAGQLPVSIILIALGAGSAERPARPGLFHLSADDGIIR
jgi:hypothetical protein